MSEQQAKAQQQQHHHHHHVVSPYIQGNATVLYGVDPRMSAPLIQQQQQQDHTYDGKIKQLKTEEAGYYQRQIMKPSERISQGSTNTMQNYLNAPITPEPIDTYLNTLSRQNIPQSNYSNPPPQKLGGQGAHSATAAIANSQIHIAQASTNAHSSAMYTSSPQIPYQHRGKKNRPFLSPNENNSQGIERQSSGSSFRANKNGRLCHSRSCSRKSQRLYPSNSPDRDDPAFIYPCQAFKQFFLTLKEGNVDLLKLGKEQSGKKTKPQIIHQFLNATGNSEQSRRMIQQLMPSASFGNKEDPKVDRSRQLEASSRLIQPRLRSNSGPIVEETFPRRFNKSPNQEPQNGPRNKSNGKQLQAIYYKSARKPEPKNQVEKKGPLQFSGNKQYPRDQRRHTIQEEDNEGPATITATPSPQPNVQHRPKQGGTSLKKPQHQRQFTQDLLNPVTLSKGLPQHQLETPIKHQPHHLNHPDPANNNKITANPLSSTKKRERVPIDHHNPQQHSSSTKKQPKKGTSATAPSGSYVIDASQPYRENGSGSNQKPHMGSNHKMQRPETSTKKPNTLQNMQEDKFNASGPKPLTMSRQPDTHKPVKPHYSSSSGTMSYPNLKGTGQYHQKKLPESLESFPYFQNTPIYEEGIRPNRQTDNDGFSNERPLSIPQSPVYEIGGGEFNNPDDVMSNNTSFKTEDAVKLLPKGNLYYGNKPIQNQIQSPSYGGRYPLHDSQQQPVPHHPFHNHPQLSQSYDLEEPQFEEDNNYQPPIPPQRNNIQGIFSPKNLKQGASPKNHEGRRSRAERKSPTNNGLVDRVVGKWEAPMPKSGMVPLRSSQKTPSKHLSKDSSSKRISFNEPLLSQDNFVVFSPQYKNQAENYTSRKSQQLEPGASSRKMNKSPSAMDDMLHPINIVSPLLIPSANKKPDHHRSSSSLLRGGNVQSAQKQRAAMILNNNPSVPNLSKLISEDPSRFEDYIESYYIDDQTESNILGGQPGSRSKSGGPTTRSKNRRSRGDASGPLSCESSPGFGTQLQDRKQFLKQSLPLEVFNQIMDQQPDEEVDDEIDDAELSKTSLYYASQKTPGTGRTAADFSYHAKPIIPVNTVARNFPEMQKSKREKDDKRSNGSTSSQNKTPRKYLKPTPSKDRKAGSIIYPPAAGGSGPSSILHTQNFRNPSRLSNAAQIRDRLLDDQQYSYHIQQEANNENSGDYVYNPNFPLMQSEGGDGGGSGIISPQHQTLNLSHLMSPQQHLNPSSMVLQDTLYSPIPATSFQNENHQREENPKKYQNHHRTSREQRKNKGGGSIGSIANLEDLRQKVYNQSINDDSERGRPTLHQKRPTAEFGGQQQQPYNRVSQTKTEMIKEFVPTNQDMKNNNQANRNQPLYYLRDQISNIEDRVSPRSRRNRQIRNSPHGMLTSSNDMKKGGTSDNSLPNLPTIRQNSPDREQDLTLQTFIRQLSGLPSQGNQSYNKIQSPQIRSPKQRSVHDAQVRDGKQQDSQYRDESPRIQAVNQPIKLNNFLGKIEKPQSKESFGSPNDQDHQHSDYRLNFNSNQSPPVKSSTGAYQSNQKASDDIPSPHFKQPSRAGSSPYHTRLAFNDPDSSSLQRFDGLSSCPQLLYRYHYHHHQHDIRDLDLASENPMLLNDPIQQQPSSTHIVPKIDQYVISPNGNTSSLNKNNSHPNKTAGDTLRHSQSAFVTGTGVNNSLGQMMMSNPQINRGDEGRSNHKVKEIVERRENSHQDSIIVGQQMLAQKQNVQKQQQVQEARRGSNSRERIEAPRSGERKKSAERYSNQGESQVEQLRRSSLKNANPQQVPLTLTNPSPVEVLGFDFKNRSGSQGDIQPQIRKPNVKSEKSGFKLASPSLDKNDNSNQIASPPGRSYSSLYFEEKKASSGTDGGLIQKRNSSNYSPSKKQLSNTQHQQSPSQNNTRYNQSRDSSIQEDRIIDRRQNQALQLSTANIGVFSPTSQINPMQTPLNQQIEYKRQQTRSDVNQNQGLYHQQSLPQQRNNTNQQTVLASSTSPMKKNSSSWYYHSMSNKRDTNASLRDIQAQITESIMQSGVTMRSIDYRLINKLQQQAAIIIQRNFRAHLFRKRLENRHSAKGHCTCGCPCHLNEHSDFDVDKFKNFFVTTVHSYMLLNSVMNGSSKHTPPPLCLDPSHFKCQHHNQGTQ